MFKKLFKYIDELIENILEFLIADGISFNEGYNWSEHVEYDEPIFNEEDYNRLNSGKMILQISTAKTRYIEYLQREQETRTLVEALVKITGITMEQFDSGDLAFEDYEIE